MPRLVYTVDLSKSPLEIAAAALSITGVREYAQRKGLDVEEESDDSRKQFLLLIPLDELNAVLDELLFAGLLHPLQEIQGRPSAHTILHERFSTLTWIDEGE